MPDQHERWTMTGTNFVYLTAGAYADIFVDRDAKRARKVFRLRRKRDAADDSFKTEIAAYVAAIGHDEVRELVPAFWGAIASPPILDDQGVDRSDHFYLDLCYELDLVEGHFQKFGVLPTSTQEELRRKFQGAGIHAIVDASVATVPDGSMKVIDFGIAGVEEWMD